MSLLFLLDDDGTPTAVPLPYPGRLGLVRGARRFRGIAGVARLRAVSPIAATATGRLRLVRGVTRLRAVA